MKVNKNKRIWIAYSGDSPIHNLKLPGEDSVKAGNLLTNKYNH